MEPNENITRVDAAVFVAKALELDVNKAPNAGFTDVPNHVLMKEVNALKEAGITNGKTEINLCCWSRNYSWRACNMAPKAYEFDAGNQKLPFTDVMGSLSKCRLCSCPEWDYKWNNSNSLWNRLSLNVETLPCSYTEPSLAIEE